MFKHTSSSDLCRGRWEIPGGRAPFGLPFEKAVEEKLRVFSNVSVEDKAVKHFYVLVAECSTLSEHFCLNPQKLREYRWTTLEEAESLLKEDLLVEGDLPFIFFHLF